jgi:uncharacterized membrane protein
MTTTRQDTRLERAIGRVLLFGTITSSTCLALGLGLSFVPGFASTADWLMNVGIVVLMATPVGRVAISVVDYAIEHDWLFVGLTIVVLGELVASVFAARR